ncbi:MAG: Crp/Fnr family transcriptional regulator [Oscillospiraceae bacterium]|jgi:CRP-like cAMP-binding protein|nr:Crp/Fnr family transcriptional regulator [Oscillospiraceae bacterium]
MSENFSVLKKCPLFAGISGSDFNPLITCLSGKLRRCSKDETIIFEGDAPGAVGIVLSGSVRVTKDDYFGNRNIISEIGAGGIFAEAVVCAQAEASPVSVTAAEETEVMLTGYSKIVTSCSSACGFHNRLVMNMLQVLGQKNLSLVDKLEHLTKRSTREKVLSYLSEQAKRAGSDSFIIPFNRQELADYLSVERSALSAELSKMQSDGIIRFRKNRFELIGK